MPNRLTTATVRADVRVRGAAERRRLARGPVDLSRCASRVQLELWGRCLPAIAGHWCPPALFLDMDMSPPAVVLVGEPPEWHAFGGRRFPAPPAFGVCVATLEPLFGPHWATKRVSTREYRALESTDHCRAATLRAEKLFKRGSSGA